MVFWKIGPMYLMLDIGISKDFKNPVVGISTTTGYGEMALKFIPEST